MRIALVSDTHLAARASALARNWRAAEAWIAAGGFDTTIHLGDVTADSAGDASELDEALAILGEPAARMRLLPGNHDVGDNPPAPGIPPGEHPATPGRIDAWRAAFGPDRWCFEAEGFVLIGLNAQRLGTALEDEQADWLAGELDRSDLPVGLFLHKPLFRDGRADRHVHVRYIPVEARERLLARIGPRLRFVVSGHAHQSRAFAADGVDQFWLPSTAFVIPDRMQESIGEKSVGTAILTLSQGRHAFEFARPADMRDISLTDCAEVYPQIVDIWRAIRDGAAA